MAAAAARSLGCAAELTEAGERPRERVASTQNTRSMCFVHKAHVPTPKIPRAAHAQDTQLH
jgi:hypothetical protein